MLDAATNETKFSSEAEKLEELRNNKGLIEDGLTVLKYPEPYNGWNASFTAAWVQMPPEIKDIPNDVKRNIILQGAQEGIKQKTGEDKESKIIHPPELVKDVPTAIAKVATTKEFVDGEKGTFISTILFTLKEDRILVISTSHEENESEETIQKLNNILKSLLKN